MLEKVWGVLHNLLDMHDIQIIVDDITLPIRKLLKTSFLHPIIGHLKARRWIENQIQYPCIRSATFFLVLPFKMSFMIFLY